MPLHRSTLLLLTLTVAFSTSIGVSAAQDDTSEGATMSVGVTHVRNDEGHVRCALFTAARGWPSSVSDARATAVVRAHNGRATCRFEGVAPGRYAVAVFHDEDDDTRLDKNAFGVPREGWGVSGGARGGAFSGPSFDDAAFTWDGTGRVRVQLGY